MTTYVAIPNGDIDQDSPVTQPLLTALRDNLLATIEGDATAPRIYGAAMFGPAAGSTVQRNCLPWGTEASGSIITGTITNLLAASPMTALVACVVQVRVTHSIAVSGGASASVAILKNGTAVQTYTTSQTGATTDVTLGAGDTLAVRTIAEGAGPGTSASVSLSVCEYRVNARSAVMT